MMGVGCILLGHRPKIGIHYPVYLSTIQKNVSVLLPVCQRIFCNFETQLCFLCQDTFPHLIYSAFLGTYCGNYPTTPKTSPHLGILHNITAPPHYSFTTTPQQVPLHI